MLAYNPKNMAISEFPKWRKYLILLSFLDNSSARPVQIDPEHGFVSVFEALRRPA